MLKVKIVSIPNCVFLLLSIFRLTDGQSCTLGPFGLICLQQYNSVDFAAFSVLGAQAGAPTDILQWTDPQRTAWTTKLKTTCEPYNKVLDCTAKNGGRKWWNCLDDDGIKNLLESLPPPKPGESNPFPSEPYQVRANFDALTDLCDTPTIDAFITQHPCMRTTYGNPAVAAYRQQLDQVDTGIKGNCTRFNCAAATAYLNVFIYMVNSACPGAGDTSLKMVGSSIRLRMMNLNDLYCNEASFPTTIATYTARPTRRPVDLMTSTGRCGAATTTTTRPATTPPRPAATTPRPVVVPTPAQPVTIQTPAPPVVTAAPAAPAIPPAPITTAPRPVAVQTTTALVVPEIDNEYYGDDDEYFIRSMSVILKDYDLEFLDISKSSSQLTTSSSILLFIFTFVLTIMK